MLKHMMPLIYCHYLMRLYDVSDMLGTLSDGRIWHTIKFTMQEGMLRVMKYTNMVAKDDNEVIAAIPNLLLLL